ncbi:MAG: hypothetical protein HZC42_13455 [Candidatus Eisenbacteria bacterium]|nr:hypothetical protein [Candidatus Eisenbacteria bacterium]
MLSDGQIAARLSKLDHVKTIALNVVNTIVSVEHDTVRVRSERTGNDRRIRFSEIRAWRRRGSNGRVRRALARAVGLDGA